MPTPQPQRQNFVYSFNIQVGTARIGCPTLLKPLSNFTLIQDPIIYDKISDIPDFQTLFTILQLSNKYIGEIAENTKEIGQYHIFFN